MILGCVKQNRFIETKSDCLKLFISNIGFLSPSLSVLSLVCLFVSYRYLFAASHAAAFRSLCDISLPTSLNSQLALGLFFYSDRESVQLLVTAMILTLPPFKSLSSPQPRVQESQFTQKHNFVFFQTLLPLSSQTNRI